MTNKTKYDKYLEDPEFRRLMAQENFIMDVTEGLCEILEQKKVKRIKLAELLGKTKGFISQLLNGSRNMTLRSLADISYCLGYRAKVIFFERESVRQNTVNLPWNMNTAKRLPRNNIQISDDYHLEFGEKISRVAS